MSLFRWWGGVHPPPRTPHHPIQVLTSIAPGFTPHSRLQRWELGYIDLLQRLTLFELAADVIKQSDDERVSGKGCAWEGRGACGRETVHACILFSSPTALLPALGD